jgi:hypothetical protein
MGKLEDDGRIAAVNRIRLVVPSFVLSAKTKTEHRPFIDDETQTHDTASNIPYGTGCHRSWSNGYRSRQGR